MIPPPVDAVLLHEHAYQDTGDLSYVLSLETFTDNGGYKPILTYGLGFFNYDLALKNEIYDKSWIEMLRFHVYEHFVVYLIIFLFIFLVWCFVVIVQLNYAGHVIFGEDKKLYKKFEKDNELEYRHIQV